MNIKSHITYILFLFLTYFSVSCYSVIGIKEMESTLLPVPHEGTFNRIDKKKVFIDLNKDNNPDVIIESRDIVYFAEDHDIGVTSYKFQSGHGFAFSYKQYAFKLYPNDYKLLVNDYYLKSEIEIKKELKREAHNEV